MNYEGVLVKMRTEFESPIQYFLPLDKSIIKVNELINQSIKISYLRDQCLECGKANKIYQQGLCSKCFFSSAEVGDWIMHPELSKAHLGIEDRDLSYEQAVQLKPHIVYLALSGNVKVGVTRKTQVPYRWIDQGATKALAILETPNRYLAGIAEVSLKGHVGDKTNWRKMLKNDFEDIDLFSLRDQVIAHLPEETKEYVLTDSTDITQLNFPVLKYPEKIKSLNILKTTEFSGILKGIKGQYLIFEDDTVFNVRSHEGRVVSLNVQ